MDLPVVPPISPLLAKAAKEIPVGDFLDEPKFLTERPRQAPTAS
ncbi:MAG: hypothetical protein M0Z30_20755 [Actinomycetota bacterium]|nr:hypothetical protein [Actinomycetota bacterium]